MAQPMWRKIVPELAVPEAGKQWKLALEMLTVGRIMKVEVVVAWRVDTAGVRCGLLRGRRFRWNGSRHQADRYTACGQHAARSTYRTHRRQHCRSDCGHCTNTLAPHLCHRPQMHIYGPGLAGRFIVPWGQRRSHPYGWRERTPSRRYLRSRLSTAAACL
jgi:hypothetical protein